MIPRARHVVAAALCGALLTLSVCTGIANAAPTGKVYPVSLARTVADVKKVAEYWKPEKLKLADTYTPATPGTQASPKTSSAASAAGPAAPAAKTAPATSAATKNAATTTAAKTAATKNATRSALPALPLKGAVARTTGKVFFRFGDQEYWCSASAVAAKNLSVVATAGHCAYDPRQGRAAQDWIFVPNPGPNGETPDGIYVGASISMHEDWPGRNDYDYDYAFVTVQRGFKWTAKSGGYVMEDVGRLQDNVGGQGLELNRRPATYTVTAFGYPQGPQPDTSRPFDGKTLRMCKEGATSWTVAPNRDLQKGVRLQPCDFTSGASGGPWLTGYDLERRLGSLNGVNSLNWNSDAKGWFDGVSSPYFDNITGAVYRRAAAQAVLPNVT
ncbi:trypsin-like serine peptidase [Nonomuraea sp. NPDC002799]